MEELDATGAAVGGAFGGGEEALEKLIQNPALSDITGHPRFSEVLRVLLLWLCVCMCVCCTDLCVSVSICVRALWCAHFSFNGRSTHYAQHKYSHVRVLCVGLPMRSTMRWNACARSVYQCAARLDTRLRQCAAQLDTRLRTSHRYIRTHTRTHRHA